MSPDDILANAERLISDAKHLHEVGRIRSAATLIVVALEELGEFVEAAAKEKYPEAVVHMGLFGDKANAHAKRQDTLAAHVLNWTMGQLTNQFCWEIFVDKTGCGGSVKFLQWLKTAVPLEFKDDQKQRMKENHELRMAGLLMKMVKENHLQRLRELGLYSNSAFNVSDNAIEQVIELAEVVRGILATSRYGVTPEPMQIVDPTWIK